MKMKVMYLLTTKMSRSRLQLGLILMTMLFGLVVPSVVEDNSYLKQIQWDKVDLSYTVVGNVGSRNQTSVEAVERTVREAFDEWEQNSCFSFRRLAFNENFQKADVKIVFTNDRYS